MEGRASSSARADMTGHAMRPMTVNGMRSEMGPPMGAERKVPVPMVLARAIRWMWWLLSCWSRVHVWSWLRSSSISHVLGELCLYELILGLEIEKGSSRTWPRDCGYYPDLEVVRISLVCRI